MIIYTASKVGVLNGHPEILIIFFNSSDAQNTFCNMTKPIFTPTSDLSLFTITYLILYFVPVILSDYEVTKQQFWMKCVD